MQLCDMYLPYISKYVCMYTYIYIYIDVGSSLTELGRVSFGSLFIMVPYYFGDPDLEKCPYDTCGTPHHEP